MHGAKTLAGAIDRGQRLLRRNGGVKGLGRFQAGVAVAAGRARLAEIFEQTHAPAAGRLAQSEESVQLAKPPYHGSFFLIDPLDGTKEFVAGRNEFTVNLALVTNGTPLLGIIGAPALGLIWRGIVGRGAERLAVDNTSPGTAEPIRTRRHPAPGAPWIVAVSRSHGDSRTEAFIAARPGAVRQMLGSAVKLGRVAEGGADIYPRLAPTSEWDVAAGHAIVTAAGGRITDSKGAALQFGSGREGFRVPEFIAWGDPAAAAFP